MAEEKVRIGRRIPGGGGASEKGGLAVRRDDDSWDLTSHVGATATLVAAGRARATNSAEPLIEDPFAEPLVRAVGIEFLIRWATGELHASDVDDPEAAWGLQRMTTELVARTRYFDQFLKDATATGIRQAVILASGLDARGYRLSWPPGMTVYEIDQPDVLQFKAETLAQLGAEPTARLRMVPADLRHDWPAALLRSGFEPARPTAWIAEGLFGYLPRTPRIACWTTSPISAHREARWPWRRSWGRRIWTPSGSKRSSAVRLAAGATMDSILTSGR